MHDADPYAKFAHTPANRLLGMELLDFTAERARIRLPARAELLQEEGVIHGGFITTLADTAAVYVLIPALADDRTLASIEFKVNFLAPARGDGEDLIATARLVQRGRTVAVCEVEVAQGPRRVAIGLFTYMQGPRRDS